MLNTEKLYYKARIIIEKSLYHPSPMGGGVHNPQPMKRSISPPELSKTGQITPIKQF